MIIQYIREATRQELRKEIKRLEKIIIKNNEFVEMIENYGLIIEYEGKEFQLTRDNLVDFNRNQQLMEIKIKNLKLQMNNIEKDIECIRDNLKYVDEMYQEMNLDEYVTDEDLYIFCKDKYRKTPQELLEE